MKILVGARHTFQSGPLGSSAAQTFIESGAGVAQEDPHRAGGGDCDAVPAVLISLAASFVGTRHCHRASLGYGGVVHDGPSARPTGRILIGRSPLF